MIRVAREEALILALLADGLAAAPPPPFLFAVDQAVRFGATGLADRLQRCS
jgi:hypothetical protein